MSKVKVRIKKTPTRLMCLFTLLLIVAASVLSSCNVTRTVTTKSEYLQRGDTTIQIVTKTVESYDAIKKN